MRGLAGPLMVAAARIRRSRSWVLPTASLALVFAIAGALASESLIVGDQSARAVLRGTAPLDRSIRLVWEGPLTPDGQHSALDVFSRLGIRTPTQALLLNPVRLGTTIVHPVGIFPLTRWLPASEASRLERCRAFACPVVLRGPGQVSAALSAPGVRMRVVGRTLLSTIPLGYSPGAGDPPVVVTGDMAGLAGIAGLSGVYRIYSWLAVLPLGRLHSWNLASFETRLRNAQAAISPLSTRFTLEAPFSGLDAARGRSSLAVHRLLLVDGGVLVALLLFVLLTASALERDQTAELERLRHAGGRWLHAAVFLLGEAAWISAAAVGAGLIGALAFTLVLAGAAGEPAGGVLAHGLLSGPGAWTMAGAWASTTLLLMLVPVLKGRRVADMAAVAAGAVLVAVLWVGTGASTAWIGLLIPLVCLSAGLVLFRANGVVLLAGERLARRSSLIVRLALIGLARSRHVAGLAIAFLAISTGLAGFALAFRATLIRGAADQAAARVPLDALVSPGSGLVSPLQLAPLTRWRALSHGVVYPVRRTEATYAAPGGTVTVPTLGVPAAALPQVHGWRMSDGPASLAVLARRLRPPGPARTPGPAVPATASAVELTVRSPNLDLSVALDLRARDGAVDRLALGTTGLRPRTLRARVPYGGWEVEAVELNELSGTAITNGHQNGENPAPATQFSAQLTLGPLVSVGGSGRVLTRTSLTTWRAVGAASAAPSTPRPRGAVPVTFQTTGWPGVVRPPQPSDSTPLPVLVGPGVAQAAGPHGDIGLTVDGLPVQARVIGVLRRFPTLAGTGGFVLADQSLLSGALDAQLPGQGRPDELWVSTAQTGGLRRALRHGPLAQLGGTFRGGVAHSLRSDPVTSGVTRTLLAAAALASLLALLGMMLVLVGPLRAPRLQEDLEAQGFGPGDLRRELRVRFAAACTLGIWPGLVIALLLTRLTVAAVGAYESGASQLSLVTVIPGWQLAALGVGLTVLCVVSALVISEALLPRRSLSARVSRHSRAPARELAR